MRSRNLFAGAAVATLLVGIAIGAAAQRPRCMKVAGRNSIEIPLSTLTRGAIDFFCYRDRHGDRLRFILARDNQGKVHSVLDTCRQCGSFHKGYTASKDELICRLCGNRYKLNEMEAGKASCVPVGLTTTQHDGVIEVKVADLEQARPLF
jgi:uncharacterized membrane protein